MFIKQHLTQLLQLSVEALCQRGELPESAQKQSCVERTRDSRHGDFASNLAMVVAKQAGQNPREIAARLIENLPASTHVEAVKIAGPGFINFHITDATYRTLIDEIRHAGKQYGGSDRGAGQKVLVEFVSANPTGPLHVGHGRGAAFGDVVARVLIATGHQTEREYYVNDAGRQMDILAVSVWLRYLEACGESVDFPENGYRGDYIREIAVALHKQVGDALKVDLDKFFEQLPNEQEARLDRFIEKSKTLLGDAYQKLFSYSKNHLVNDIRVDLHEFGVDFDNWFSERSLSDNGDITRAIDTLTDNGYIYEKDGAKWFKATDFGDQKDRVVVRANGLHTYFASDISYHFNKGERGFNRIVDVFGADHHGYASRIKASCQALGFPSERVQVLLVQFAVLYRGGVKISMSTRSGEFVTLRELREEVGNDAARFFYVSRKNDQHIDFDLDLAKAQSSDNPVYYIQYAHARICSVFRQLAERQMPNLDEVAPDYQLLQEPREIELMKTMSRFPEVVEQSAVDLEPHLLAYYLRTLANDFHAYYNAHPFLASDVELRQARLGLIDATRQVIANGLALLGISAPQKM